MTLTIKTTFVFIFALTVSFVQTFAAHAQNLSEYAVLKAVHHNSTYFTQGLELYQGVLYESSGLYGKSKVRKYHPDGDDTISEAPLPERIFAEGITFFANELFLLSWKEQTLFVLEPETLEIKRELKYKGEGWGLASNTRQLIMSNGSDQITFRNPESFAVERQIRVHFNKKSIKHINELEYAQGYLWSNIWKTPFVIKIKPTTGEIVSIYDFSELTAQHTSGKDERVLNGIAYDNKRNAFWLTGKYWSKRYLVDLR